jgi:nicotinate (nicotinamide) nucleotide adenylyltransferase/putative HD superfamily hydrolase of NAD metabolism
MAKIGIMGGTFNPIHNVHLSMAEEARTQYQLDEVCFMPSKNPPHKNKQGIVSDSHRKRMIQHAIQNHPHFTFSDLELKREGTTFTRDTLAYLTETCPEDQFYFILGGDSLASLENWKDPAYIFSHCHILAANRGDISEDKIIECIHYYKEKYGAHISEIQMPSQRISSEMIRNKLASGCDVSTYCPVSVTQYIRFHGLYDCDRLSQEEAKPPMKTSDMYAVLSACLKPKRYIHTLGVAMTAANLAEVHGCDSNQAYTAGLLHDCAKYLTGNEQITACQSANISLTKVELENTALIHGKLGAHIAKTRYGIRDKEILSAITWHTTGKPKMTLLEKIIYLADYMEPGRTMNCKPYSLAQIRRASFENIDKALYMVLECSVKYLEKSGVPIDPQTIDTYKYYRKKTN